MSTAKYYIYRNLHKDCFSVRHKGRVIAHLQNIIAGDVSFIVSQKGRERVLKEKKKYVHAYVACRWFSDATQQIMKGIIDTKEEIKYNPYKNEHFEMAGQKIETIGKVIMSENKVFDFEFAE